MRCKTICMHVTLKHHMVCKENAKITVNFTAKVLQIEITINMIGASVPHQQHTK